MQQQQDLKQQIIGSFANGWKKILIQGQNQVYFWNEITGESQWQMPEQVKQIIADQQLDLSCCKVCHSKKNINQKAYCERCYAILMRRKPDIYKPLDNLQQSQNLDNQQKEVQSNNNSNCSKCNQNQAEINGLCKICYKFSESGKQVPQFYKTQPKINNEQVMQSKQMPSTDQIVVANNGGNNEQQENQQQPNLQPTNDLSKNPWNFDSYGPCSNCKGWGKNLVNYLTFCCRCYKSAIKEQQNQQGEIKSSLQINYEKQLEYQQKYGKDQDFNFKELQQKKIKALEFIQQELKSKESQQLQAPNLIITPEEAERISQKILQREFKSKNLKRKNPFNNGKDNSLNKTDDVAVSGAQLDPLDPASYCEIEKSDTIINLCKAADETAQGPLFQKRPYPNPSQVLQTMKKKSKMI